MTIPNFWLTNPRIQFPNETIDTRSNHFCFAFAVDVDFIETRPRTSPSLRLHFLSAFSHCDGRRLQNLSRNFHRSVVASHLNCSLCLLVFGVRCALLGFVSRLSEFVQSRAFRNWANANATQSGEVTPQIDNDAIQHSYSKTLGAKHSL